MGPDAFPDIYVGQKFAHRQTGIKSGDWIKYLMDQVKKLPAQSDERKKALAFTLGYVVHASGDLFGHAYVNNWAKGSWSGISDPENASLDDAEVIMRHLVVEGYIDNHKVPERYKTDEYQRIAAPKEFIHDNLIANGKNPNYDDVRSDDVNISPFYARTGSTPMHLGILYRIRENLKRGIASRESYNPVRIYMEYWLEDIDNGLRAWVETSERVAKAFLLRQNSFPTAINELEQWGIEHFTSMVGAPDFVGGAVLTASQIYDVIEEIIPESLRQFIEDLKRGFYDKLLNMAYGINYADMVNMFNDPGTYFDRPGLFPTDARVRLDSDTNNLNMLRPFKNSVMMAKLNLIGREGMEQILRMADVERVGADIYPPICFIKALDVGYDWNDISFEGLRIWDDHWARASIFDKIFEPESTRYKWLSKNERDVLDAYNAIMNADPDPSIMHYYSEWMKNGWTKEDVENDLRQYLANQAYLDDYRQKTEITEEIIYADTVINSLHQGMPRRVYKNLDLNGKQLTVNCNLEIYRTGSINLNGGTLIVNGDLILVESGVIVNGINTGGVLLVNGGNVIVHGNLVIKSGIVDMGRGTMSVDGDLELSGGLLDVNEGRANIAGNFGISAIIRSLPGATGPYTRYIYGGGNGILKMNNDDDYVSVGGNFVTTSKVSHENYLTAGTLEVKGDFYQASWAYGCHIHIIDGVANLFINDAVRFPAGDRMNFKASDNHRVLLSGDRNQNVGMVLTGLNDSQFNILEVTNNAGVNFVTKVTVAKLFDHNNNAFTLTDAENSIFPDYDGDGQKDNEDTTPSTPSATTTPPLMPKPPTLPNLPTTTIPITQKPSVTAADPSSTAPTNLKASVVGSSIKLQWTVIKSENLVGYFIYRGTTSGQQDKDPLNNAPITGNEYTDTNVKRDTTYYYIVKAVYSDGSYSQPSAEVVVTIR